MREKRRKQTKNSKKIYKYLYQFPSSFAVSALEKKTKFNQTFLRDKNWFCFEQNAKKKLKKLVTYDVMLMNQKKNELNKTKLTS